MVGFALVAIAMAYAIIDVPSTGNARLPQRRFLIFRQLPLLLASLILAAWWAVFRNVHGSEPFQPKEWLPRFVAFSVATYLTGGLLAWVSLSFRKPEQKARPGRFIDSVLRLGTIVLTAAFAGFCLWAMAMRLFLFPSETEFVLNRDCQRDPDRKSEKPFWNQTPPYPSFKVPAGTRFLKISESATCPESHSPGAPLAENEFALSHDCNPVEIPRCRLPRRRKCSWPTRVDKKLRSRRCTQVSFAWEDLNALEPVRVPAPAQYALNYVCFAPALILGGADAGQFPLHRSDKQGH